MRIEISDGTLSWIEAGRALVMDCFRPAHGISFGYQRLGSVAGASEVSDGGQTWTFIRHRVRGLAVTWLAMSDTEIAVEWESIRVYARAAVRHARLSRCRERDRWGRQCLGHGRGGE